MDNAARTRQRVLAIFLPVTAVLYISAEALSPKGTDQVISTTATALKVLPIAASHPARLYVAGSLALLGFGGLGVSYAAIAALVAQRSGLVLVGPFVRNGKTSMMQRLLLRVAMAPPWAAISWKSYLPKLYAGRRPADFGEYRDQVVASLRRPGYAKAFSRTRRTSHDPAEARLSDVTAPALVVMGEQDPDFRDPRAEADWIARALRGQVVMVPEAGHYPQSQRPTSPPAQSCASWNRSRAVPRAGRRAAVLPGTGATAWGYCP
jgi:pimeloyl-ACP methyl ester carboxylesterase